MSPPHGKFAVPGGNGQTLRFSGALLSTSDSRREGADRWVEFSLYRSDGGSFVLGRVGHSLLVHRPDCDVVARNRLEVGVAGPGSVCCKLCQPDLVVGPVCPETPRYWAAIFDDPQALVKSLQRSSGEVRYVTNVAARLIETACIHDRSIADVWSSTLVD